jgi:prepilin-type N-terminal cleavage/methylation domain-containing protein
MRKSRKAFTLVEILVVIGITTLLAAAAIGYSHIGQNEDALTVETAKVAELMLQARELAIATYGGTFHACAYGVTFDYGANGGGAYSMFYYLPAGSSGRCAGPDNAMQTGLSGAGGPYMFEIPEQSGSWDVAPTQGVKLVGPGSSDEPSVCAKAEGRILNTVLFYPPNPTTLVSYDGTTLVDPDPTSIVCLETVDGQNASVITVNAEGQISF